MSAAASSSSPSPYRLTFEGSDVWVGSYGEAKRIKESSRRFRYLSDECAICQEKFEELEAVFLLVCEHGFHESCYEGWKGGVCPLDRIPDERGMIQSITFLGQTILFPNKTRKFGAWIVSQRKAIEAAFQKTFADHPPEFEMLKFAQTALQEAINVYEGQVTEAQFPERAEAVLSSLREALTHSETRALSQIPEILDLIEVGRDIGHTIEKSGFPTFLFVLVAAKTNLNLDIKGAVALHHFLLELYKGGDDLTFFKEQLDRLENLSSSQRVAYLSNLDSSSFSRLQQLAQLSNPSCQKVQQQMRGIEVSRRHIKLSLAAVALALFSTAYFHWTASGKE